MKQLRYGFRILVYYFLVRFLEEILRTSWPDKDSTKFYQRGTLEKESTGRLKCRLKAATPFNGSILAVHYLADPLKTADLDEKAKRLFLKGKGIHSTRGGLARAC